VRQRAARVREPVEADPAVVVSAPSTPNKSLEDNSRRAFGFRSLGFHIIASGFQNPANQSVVVHKYCLQ
jgi:hypothetical protein